ncbi:MAG: hypothetical protein ACPGMR_02855 [Pontibacterium sp.]
MFISATIPVVIENTALDNANEQLGYMCPASQGNNAHRDNLRVMWQLLQLYAKQHENEPNDPFGWPKGDML